MAFYFLGDTSSIPYSSLATQIQHPPALAKRTSTLGQHPSENTSRTPLGDRQSGKRSPPDLDNDPDTVGHKNSVTVGGSTYPYTRCRQRKAAGEKPRRRALPVGKGGTVRHQETHLGIFQTPPAHLAIKEGGGGSLFKATARTSHHFYSRSKLY